MAALTDLLMQYGYWGMLMAAFLAGSFFPFSSEVVMLGLLAAGLDPWPLIIYGTIGNVLGSLFNYAVGRMGKLEWIERYLHVKPETLQKAERFMGGHGALMGFFAFIPLLGSAITIVLGYTRANLLLSTTSITIGKLVRYVILVYSVLWGAQTLTAADTPEEPTATVTVTIAPLAWFVDQLTGSTITVQTMVPAGASPETYEPTARQMVELAQSALYIKVGQIGFETTWMDRLKANAPHTKVVDASAGIRYIESTPGIPDPHTWMSCSSARTIAKNIHHALAAQFPHKQELLDQHLATLLARIDSTDRAVRRHLGQTGQRSFVIYHPALTYFAHDYHLTQLPIEEEGREPNAASMQQLIERARQTGARTIFVQREFSPRNTVAIRNATGARPAEINPLDYDWPKQMTRVSEELGARKEKREKEKR